MKISLLNLQTFLFITVKFVVCLRTPFPVPPKLLFERDPPIAKWFEQNLDHFNIRDERTWKQRYWIGWDYYVAGGPIFILIGGEGEENPGWLNAGALHDYAKQFNGAMFILEHRYYGQSKPVPDLKVKNLAWLSSHQALADIATFIVSMKEQLKLEGPWISIGGSYPGSLSSWLRLKYPHLVAGAVASSGPVNAKPDFPEYLEVVDTALKAENDLCSRNVKTAVGRLQFLTQHRVGWAMLTKKFKLCKPFDGSKKANIATLMETLLGNFETIIQYNKDKKTGKWSNITTQVLCDIMTNAKFGSELERFVKVNDLSLQIANSDCLDADYENKVNMLLNTDYSDPSSRIPGDVGNRQWFYQTCTQFGWYQSSDQADHPFGDQFPLDFFIQMCTDVFGPKFDKELLESGIQQTLQEYGGLDISVSNVVFVHGSLDPWHALGILEDKSPSSPAIVINGTAHCANLYPPTDEDPQSLKDARLRIGELIKKWINK